MKISGILKQLLKVVQGLGSLEIIHNNIKSSSIFVIESNNKFKVCLGEFQKARFMEHPHPNHFDDKNFSRYHLAP